MEKPKIKRERVSCIKSNLKVTASLFTAVACLLCGGSTQLIAAENDSKAPQCVYISGEVKIPGRYAYTNDLALDKAIEMAKGVTSKASDKVVLRREGDKEQTFKLKAIQQGDAKGTKLKPGDKVFVPRKE
jgi:protein involved in polysaccharide export with SLBB domain